MSELYLEKTSSSSHFRFKFRRSTDCASRTSKYKQFMLNISWVDEFFDRILHWPQQIVQLSLLWRLRQNGGKSRLWTPSPPTEDKGKPHRPGRRGGDLEAQAASPLDGCQGEQARWDQETHRGGDVGQRQKWWRPDCPTPCRLIWQPRDAIQSTFLRFSVGFRDTFWENFVLGRYKLRHVSKLLGTS